MTSENLRIKRAAVTVIPNNYQSKPLITENIQAVLQNCATAPYFLLQMLEGTYYMEDQKVISQLGLEFGYIVPEELRDEIWKVFFLRVGAIESWPSAYLLRISVGINPSQNRFYLCSWLRERAMNELNARVYRAPETFSVEFLMPLFRYARQQQHMSSVGRMETYFYKRKDANRLKAIDEEPVSPDDTTKDVLTEEEKKYLRIFLCVSRVVFVPAIPLLYLRDAPWDMTYGGEEWMEAGLLYATWILKLGPIHTQHSCDIGSYLVEYDDRKIIVNEIEYTHYFPKAVVLTPLFMLPLEGYPSLHFYKYAKASSRKPDKSHVICIQPPHVLCVEGLLVGPRWKEINERAPKTLPEVIKHYQVPIGARGWEWEDMDRTIEWSQWAEEVSIVDEEALRRFKEQEAEERRLAEKKRNKENEKLEAFRYKKRKAGLCDVLRVRVSTRQQKEVEIALGSTKYPDDIVSLILRTFAMLTGSQMGEDRVSEALDTGGTGKYRSEQRALKSMQEFVENVPQYGVVAFKRSMGDAFAPLTGDEAGGVHIYLAVRQKDTGLVAWVNSNNPGNPQRVGTLTRIVGFYQESTMKSAYANGMDYSEWTVFRLEAGSVDIEDRRSLMWFVVYGGPRILYYPFVSVKRYVMPTPAHTRFGELRVKGHRISWRGYQTPDMVPHDPEISFTMHSLAGGDAQQKKRKGEINRNGGKKHRRT
jgi:hypothetical protein